MSKKNIAYIIQGTLILAILAIGLITYNSVENDQRLRENKFGPAGASAACPPSQKRACTQGAYSTKPINCPVVADECNSQSNLKFCFIYSWKENRPTGDCRNCDGSTVELFSERVYMECNSGKDATGV